jgi:type VI secretion system protein ImpL
VYLLITKCDLVAGFTEYFDDLPQEGRSQVWGVTFPYQLTTSGQAAAAFPAEFTALATRLNERVFARVEEERDVKRRAAIFAFPQQWAALGEVLGLYVQELFASSRFDANALLRGVYFTSGTQEGTPIDRILGALGRSIGAAAGAVSAPAGRGKAYFIERLLKDVMFAESGLAGVNKNLEQRKLLLQVATYASVLLITILGIIAFSISYSRNHAYLNDVQASLAKLQQQPALQSTASIEQILPRLDAVREVAAVADRYHADAPLMMRWGLFQGNSIGNQAQDAYRRELSNLLLPQIAQAIKQRLIAYTAEPDKLYEYLKTYLMLGQPEHLDKAQMRFW